MKKNQQQPAPARELKVAPHYIKSIDGRTVTGIASVFGNLDSYNDRIWPGAFTKTISERGSKVYHLWQHSMDQPAIAIIRSLREVGRTELPQAVLDAAPDATGGLEVTREYLDTPRANEVLLGLQAGITYEMSFAFDPIRYDFEEDENNSYWGAIRNLREVRLYETSDVLWGANAATVASKMPLDLLLRQVAGILAEMKAGRRHSDGDMKLINQIAQAALDLGAENVTLLDESKQTISDADLKTRLQLPAGRKTQDAIGITGLWLRSFNEKVQALVEVDRRWRLVIDEVLIADEGLISHIVEPLGIRQAPSDSITETDEPKAYDSSWLTTTYLELARLEL